MLMDNNKKRIVIIEDDEHVSKIYEVKFAKEGIATSFARDGEEGMAKILTEKPDLVILELMLPRKDGFAEEIKNTPDLIHIPVLVLSNLGGASDIERTLALGAKEHLIKVNHSMQEVIDKANEYLGSRG
jgi:DNA-binding response OmpR family regulator